MTLPLLLSVPHAGTRVPPEAQPYCILTTREVVEDGDVGAREIYDLASEVEAFHTTEIARAIVDLNRAVDDFRPDGVVKTHTCWSVPVYGDFPPQDVVTGLLDRYYRPYHARLRQLATSADVKLGIDCHTMAAYGPPVGPDPGAARPSACLSNGEGTCPQLWIEAMQKAFQRTIGPSVTINHPFQGGFITRTHAEELPFIQLEMSRAPFMTDGEKRAAVLEALRGFCQEVFST
ncbi:MAG TPA: N-formylglutamate amidohydrolase [Vicinamibacteria bacterium]|nr:N-formylglutamate amidohydrolase [Vicinamibacteria bacterium]